jgi:hypothetical protein
LLLLAVGAVAALIAVGRSWGTGAISPSVGPSTNQIGVEAVTSGPPLARALALVAVVSILAVFAVRGVARAVVGGVVTAAGLGVLASCAAHGGSSGWRWVAMVGGLLIAAAGVLVVRHGRSWPSMSNRYEREARAAGKPLTPWDAIDRGEDPTE